MDHAISEPSVEDDAAVIDAERLHHRSILPALAVALIATSLIAEAIFTIIHGRANGDLMITVCPIVGSLFLSIPAARAWWIVLAILTRR